MPPKRTRKPAATAKSVKKASADADADAKLLEGAAGNDTGLDESVDSTEELKANTETSTSNGSNTMEPTAAVTPEEQDTVATGTGDVGEVEQDAGDDMENTDLEDELLEADGVKKESVDEPVPELEEVSDDEEINDSVKKTPHRAAERKLEAVVEITKEPAEESSHDTEKNILSMAVELSSTKKSKTPKRMPKTRKTEAKEVSKKMEDELVDDTKECKDVVQKEDTADHETDTEQDAEVDIEKSTTEDNGEDMETSKDTSRELETSKDMDKEMDKEMDMSELHDTEAERDEELKQRKVTFVQEPYPESFEKLRQLTVNIGPVKQCDLMSEELHSILSLNPVFAINFDLKDVEDTDTAEEKKSEKEKLGFVRIPFVMRSPQFLLIVTHKLSKLNIDGRDMSVKFPQEFNDSLEEIKAYVDRADKGRQEKMQYFTDLRKRQLIMRNVPETINEETVKALFPESTYIQIKNSHSDGKPRSVVMDFETEDEATKCFETNKDIEIDDCKVTLLFPHKAKLAAFEIKRRNYNRANWKANVGFGSASRFGRGLGFAARRGVGFGTRRGTGFGFRGAGRFGIGRGFGSTFRGRGRGAAGPDREGYPEGVAQAQFVADRFVRERKQEEKIQQLQRLVEQQTSNLAKAGMGGSSYGSGARGQDMGSPHRDRRSSGVYSRPGERRSRSRDRSPYRRDYNNSRRSPPGHRMGRGGYSPRESFRGGRDSGQSWDRTRRDSHPGASYRDSDMGDRRRDDRGRPGEDDQVAMMTYLKTTLAKMENKIAHRSREVDERHVGKRKADYDDYNRGDSKKRYEPTPGQRDYRDRRTSPGRSSPSRDQNWGRGSSFRGRGGFNARGRGHPSEGRGRRW